MKVTVTAITKEIGVNNKGEARKAILKAVNSLRLHTSKTKIKNLFKSIIIGFKVFAGKQAAICYAEDKYIDERIQDDSNALKRFEQIIPTLHHSIADHVNITLLLEGIPKILAMILNSLGQYATSEKSGRYTKMSGASKLEKEKYDKWLGIFDSLIQVDYPEIDDKTRVKLSMENARYMLSVFTPTTMSYTTSLRQYNYIMDWLERFCNNESVKRNSFYKKLVKPMVELNDKISFLYIHGLRDMKNRSFSFLAKQTDSPSVDVKESFGGETYTVRYNASFAQLAQAQRHRTLSYKMCFDKYRGNESLRFYIPPILLEGEGSNDNLVKDWIKDLVSLQNKFPQATLVDVIESGEVEKFFLKCEERICGRAQLEIARKTESTYFKLLENTEAYGDSLKNLIQSYKKEKDGDRTRIKAKCECLSCKEACRWGAKNAITRKI